MVPLSNTLVCTDGSRSLHTLKHLAVDGQPKLFQKATLSAP